MGGPISQCCCDTEGGYKHVVAAVRWLGGEHPYGYLTPAENSLINTCADVGEEWWNNPPCPGSVCSTYIPYSPDPPDHKYLGFQLEITWDHHQSRYATCDTCVTTDIVWDFHFRRSYDSLTDRYSAAGTGSDVMTWDEIYVDNVVSANSYEYHLTGAEALARFNAMSPPYISLDAACGHLEPTGPLNNPSEWTVISEGVTDNSCHVTCEMNVDTTTNNACTCDSNPFTDDDHLIKTASFSITTLLYDKFTTAELYQTAKNLLALWNLGDDTRYPWRTSCGVEAYHLGALVTFDYGGDIFGTPGATIGGPYTGETWSSGAHSLIGYSAEGSSGGCVWFNNEESVFGIVVGGVIVPYGDDYFILGKWAEKKITLPGHNYARPCGTDHWAKVENTYASDLCWPPASMVNTLTSDGTNPSDGDQVAISNGATATYTTYTFRTTPGALPEVQIGADATASMLNLKNAINAYPDPLVTATVSGLVITITGGAATKYYHFHECTTSVVTLTWAYPVMIGPACTGACNNATSADNYTTMEITWSKRDSLEATRMNGMAALCTVVGPEDGSPCSDVPSPLYTVDPTWTHTCTQESASAGTILYCSPNTEDFGASPTEQKGTWPGANDYSIADDKYGYLWQFHIRQAMPDPLIACDYLYASAAEVLLEEAECSVPGGCPALTDGVLYCPDSDEAGCGFQDTYGMQCPPL